MLSRVHRISFLLALLWVQVAGTRERHEVGVDAQMAQCCEKGPCCADWEERASLPPPPQEHAGGEGD